MCGTAGLPHVIVRFFTVKNVSAVRKSACWTLAFIAVIYLTAPAIGAFSRVNLIEKLNGVSYQQAPDWLKKFEKTEQMAWVDKNGDGIINIYGPKAAFEGKESNSVFIPFENDKKPQYHAAEDTLKGEHGHHH